MVSSIIINNFVRKQRLKTYTVKKEILIEASAESVFSALTNSVEIPLFYPLSSVESRWVEGSEVLYKGDVDGAAFIDYGIIEKLDSPRTFRYRYWSDNHGTERIAENYISMDYTLESMGGNTLLTLVQSNIQSVELYELMQSQVWDFLLGSLKEYLE